VAEKHIFSSEKVFYHIAVIDYLQEWNLNKKSERFIKTMVMQKDPIGLSAIEP
jgi:Phosphatidylinositol-4-phosphate 5-Kinase